MYLVNVTPCWKGRWHVSLCPAHLMPQIEFVAREERAQPRGDQPHRILSHFTALPAHFTARGHTCARAAAERCRWRQVHGHPVAGNGG